MRIVEIKDDGTPEELTPLQQTDNGDAEVKDYEGEPSKPTEDGIPDIEPQG